MIRTTQVELIVDELKRTREAVEEQQRESPPA